MKYENKIINAIPFDLAQKYASYNSDLCEFLCMEFGADTAIRVVDDYAIGNIDGKSILWNIDTDGEVHGGYVISYNKQGYIRNDWRDSMTVDCSSDDAMLVGWYCKEVGFHDDVEPADNLTIGDIDERFRPTDSLFGLHLCKVYPSKPIALVEAHKAALIGAALQPDYNWMAIGCNVRDLDVDALRKLRGKQIIVFPSNHDYYDWCKLASKVNFLSLKVSSIMEKYPSDWKQDVGDILLQDFRANGGDISTPKTKPQPVIKVQVSPQQKVLNDMIEQNPSVGLLVSKLDLELV